MREVPGKSCVLCEDEDTFCQVEDIWWLCGRCAMLESSHPGHINQAVLDETTVKLKKVMVNVKKISCARI